LRCELLTKNECNKYTDMKNDNLSESIVGDGPCFFNGDDDGSELRCVKKWTIVKRNDCGSIETNSIIMYEGETRESCNEAHIIFGYSFKCGWVDKYIKNTGHCGRIYHLTENSLHFFYFLIVDKNTYSFINPFISFFFIN
jgi:hypothetical protein